MHIYLIGHSSLLSTNLMQINVNYLARLESAKHFFELYLERGVIAMIKSTFSAQG